jgi:hypothetical protein
MVRRAMSLDEPQSGPPPQLAARALSGVDQATFSFLDAQLARFQADPRCAPLSILSSPCCLDPTD